MPELPKVEFNWQLPMDQVMGLFKDAVGDVTSAELQAIVNGVLEGGTRVGMMRAQNADPLLIEEALDTLRAQGQSALAIPGLIAAEKSGKFLEILYGAGQIATAIGFNLARAYLGLPPLPASPTT